MVANRAEYMIAHFAVMRRCAPRSCRSTRRAQEHDTGHILQRLRRRCWPSSTRTNRALIDGLRGERPALRDVLVVAGEEPGGLSRLRAAKAGRSTSPRRDCRPEDITHIYYTSGTTGAGEGLHARPQAGGCACVDIELRLNPKAAGDRMLSCLPFHYADPAVMLACTVSQRRHAGGDAPLQRLAVLGRRPRT